MLNHSSPYIHITVHCQHIVISGQISGLVSIFLNTLRAIQQVLEDPSPLCSPSLDDCREKLPWMSKSVWDIGTWYWATTFVAQVILGQWLAIKSYSNYGGGPDGKDAIRKLSRCAQRGLAVCYHRLSKSFVCPGGIRYLFECLVAFQNLDSPFAIFVISLSSSSERLGALSSGRPFVQLGTYLDK